MAEPYLGEIKIFSFAWAPRNWAQCNGQLLSINDNQALYALMGTQYGGDGRSTMGLPDLRGRAPVHPGAIDIQSPGQIGGYEQIQFNANTMPQHSHIVNTTNSNGDTSNPKGGELIAQAVDKLTAQSTPIYGSSTNLTAIENQTIGNTGAGTPWNIMQPSCAVNFCIALQGLFPSRN